MRVIQISGLRGILTVVFIATCLVAGFVAFPAIVAMNVWNYATRFITLPTIGIIQGLLLWSIIAIIGFIINDRNKYLVAYQHKTKLSEKELKMVMDNIKIQAQTKALNSMLLKSEDLKAQIKKEEISEKKDKENL